MADGVVQYAVVVEEAFDDTGSGPKNRLEAVADSCRQFPPGGITCTEGNLLEVGGEGFVLYTWSATRLEAFNWGVRITVAVPMMAANGTR